MNYTHLLLLIVVILGCIILSRFHFQVIPLNIYQTWSTKELPEKMKQCVDHLKKMNPEFKHHLYDDKDCRKFIQKNFDDSVLDAFDRIIPGAYKADLWRYCVLYKKGGIYLDIKFQCQPGFKLMELTDKEYFVKDLDNVGVYNGVMVCKEGNTIMLDCIHQCVKNVNTNYYGLTSLHPTGPMLLATFFTTYEVTNMELVLNKDPSNFYISKNGERVLYYYPGYREEQQMFQKTKHYGELWRERNIYIKDSKNIYNV